MSTASSSTGQSKKAVIFKVGLDGNVYCNHDMLSICRVAGSRSTRHGKEFYSCPLWPRSDFKFFIWKEDVNLLLEGQGNYKLLEMKNKTLKMKVENLEVEKMMLEEENKSLKLKLGKAKHMSNKSFFFAFAGVVIALYLYLNF